MTLTTRRCASTRRCRCGSTAASSSVLSPWRWRPATPVTLSSRGGLLSSPSFSRPVCPFLSRREQLNLLELTFSFPAVMFPFVCVIYAITGFKTDVQQLAQMLGAAVVPGNSQANMCKLLLGAPRGASSSPSAACHSSRGAHLAQLAWLVREHVDAGSYRTERTLPPLQTLRFTATTPALKASVSPAISNWDSTAKSRLSRM